MPTIIANDPQYGQVYSDEQGCFVYDAGIPVPFPCITNSLPATQPKVITNTGGVVVKSGQTTLDKILGTVLSLAALSKNAAYVPTEVQPTYGGGGYRPIGSDTSERQVIQQIAQNNALGTLEAWVKAHPIPVAIGLAVGVAYILPSPRQRR
jgi:hypothetical protein